MIGVIIQFFQNLSLSYIPHPKLSSGVLRDFLDLHENWGKVNQFVIFLWTLGRFYDGAKSWMRQRLFKVGNNTG